MFSKLSNWTRPRARPILIVLKTSLVPIILRIVLKIVRFPILIFHYLGHIEILRDMYIDITIYNMKYNEWI